VSIAIFPKYVKIQCDKESFSRENIEALCRVGRSPKKLGQGYTGEKGIGFKSVFKLADRAYIRSYPYYFQLDRTRKVGIITPQWDEDLFDDYKGQYQTTIVLDNIRDRSTTFSTALRDDVTAIDPVLILFLWRIKRFHLKLFRSSLDDEPAISKCFRRVNWTGSGFVSVKDEDANTMRYFYKYQFTIDCDGTKNRQLYSRNASIVLAFPVEKESSTYMPLIQKQNPTFAYLPLGDFGFRV